MMFLIGLWSASFFCHAAPGRTIRLPIAYRKFSHHDRRRILVPSTAGNSSASEIPPFPAEPLFQAPGVHYVALEVGCGDGDDASGRAARTVTLIVDTGSGATAFPCGGCHGCDSLHMDRRYNETAATCYRASVCRHNRDCRLGRCVAEGRHPQHRRAPRSCRIHRRYDEGSSWVADEGSDRVRLGPDGAALNLTFGCQTAISDRFRRQAVDGILGLDRRRSSLWWQAHDQGLIDHRSFALCLRRLRGERDAAPAGAMVLGGADDALDETSMVFANMLTVDDFYAVHVENIHLRMHGGGSVRENRQSHYNIRYETVNVRSSYMNRSPFIVDSGTTVTYLNEFLEYPFSDAWRALTGRHYSPYREYHYGRDELNDVLPTILFQLSPWRREENDLSAPGIVNSLDKNNRHSILVAMPPTHYMRYIEEDNVWVPHIFFDSDLKQTLGSNFLQGKNVLFDIDNQRMGFAESSCSPNSSEWAAASWRNDMKRYAPFLDRLHDSADRLQHDVVSNKSSRTWLCLGALPTVLGIAACILLRSRRLGSAQEATTKETDNANGETQALVSPLQRLSSRHHYTSL